MENKGNSPEWAEELMIRAYQHSRNPRGFWPIPWRKGAWTASLLVEKAEKEDGFTETGGMWYVLGELFRALDGRILGEYYPYRVNGEHDHDHSFLTVMRRAIETGTVEPEKTEEYYAPWMVDTLRRTRERPDLRSEAMEWARDPLSYEGEYSPDKYWNLSAVCPELTLMVYELRIAGEKVLVQSVEEVYELAASIPDVLEYDPEEYSRQQIENIEAILDYQRAALAGEAP